MMMSRTPVACAGALLLLAAISGCDNSGSAGTATSSSNTKSGEPPALQVESNSSPQQQQSSDSSRAAPDTPAIAPAADLDSIPIGYRVGERAPEWRLRDPNGKEHSLADYRGSVVVMDFWATWCGPCRKAMPGMQKLHEELSPRGVKVFGITTGETGNPAAYMSAQNYSYGLLLNGDKVAGQYGVRGIPAFFVVGVDGRILDTQSGFDPTGRAEKQLHEVIVKHLDEHGL